MYAGLGCADCGGTCPMATPKGMGSIDLSTLSWEDYLLMGIGGAIFVSLWSDSKPKKRRRARAKSSVSSDAWVFPLIGIAAAGSILLWYSGTQNA